jgi:hypothetical protein
LTKKVLLAGEGKHELGGWYAERAYHSAPPQPGVLEELARRVVPHGWIVSDARVWKTLPLYQARVGGREARRIMQLANDAKERGFDALVFSRDGDTGPDAEDRAEDIRTGLAVARGMDGVPPIAGAVAVPCLEGWVAATLGVSGTRAMSKPAIGRSLHERRVDATLEAMVEAVRAAPTQALDAQELVDWRQQVMEALT